jgi:hypothetical protein
VNALQRMQSPPALQQGITQIADSTCSAFLDLGEGIANSTEPDHGFTFSSEATL